MRCVLAVLLAAACRGEDTKSAPPAAPAAIKIGSITISGSFRSRFEEWNWFQSDTGDPTYGYSGNLLRLSLSQSKEVFDWQLEFALPFLLGLPNNAIAAGVQGQLGLGAAYFAANNRSQYTAMAFVKQGVVRFHRGSQSVRLGRFEFLDGSEATSQNATLATIKRDRIQQRLIGNFGWAHAGRSLDGIQYLYSKPSGTFTFVGAVPTRGVFQTDGWGENDTAVGYTAYTKPWGRGVHTAETRLLGIYYDDWRPVLKTDNRSPAARREDFDNIRIFTFGGHHLSALSTGAGTLDFLAWGVGQTGRWGRLDQRSYALDFETGFQPHILSKLKPWLRAGYTIGSGDGNPSDHTHGTFFQILPTPRPFARFPFFNMENTRDTMAALILRPHKDVTTSSEFHSIVLANAADLWYSGGGVYNPWVFGYTGRPAGGAKSLANLYDTSIEYRIRPSVAVTAYGGYAQGLAVIRTTYPKGAAGALGYLELNYRL